MNYKVCNKCKAQLPNEAMFCTNCGASLDDSLEDTGILYDDDEMSTTVLNENIEEIPPTSDDINSFHYEEPSKNINPNSVPQQYVNPMYQNTNNTQGQTQQTNQFGQQNSYVQNVPVSSGNTYGQTGYQSQGAVEKPSIIDCYKKFWQNYTNFSGRARRSEYWYVVLINMVISLVSAIPNVGPALCAIYTLAAIVPTIALIVRRLHDLGKEWYNIFIMFIPIVGQIIMIVWFCTDSQVGANEFGENPKGIN